MNKFLAILFLMVVHVAYGQKYMILGQDTLLNKDNFRIMTDTEYYVGKTLVPGDTLYERACLTFEKINGLIVNLTDADCLRQGLWLITDSLGNYWIGNYQNNHKAGVWKHYDKSQKLLKETEEVSVGMETYKVKEIDYSSGKPVTIFNRTLLSFYIKNLTLIVIIIFSSFFARPFINSRIYNRENGTNLSLFYFGLPFNKKYWEYASHSLMCVFTFWFFNYKSENRQLVIISNTLSAISLGTFFGLLIGLAFNGDLH